MKHFLGIDCGSTSIKLVVINADHELVTSVYLRNRGIIDTLKEAFQTLHLEQFDIQGCGVTGSGRNFVKALVKADLVKSEVIAHSIATMEHYPETKTIFEIGGEDCKLMTIEDGMINDFKMNNICGGGTGSMIETIATRLGVPVEEVGNVALRSTIRIDLPGKCGIFCQSAVVSKLNSGCAKEDILMGVCRALIRNYLNICKGATLQPPYVFQGATAQNKALAKALEDEIGEDITVPEHCSLMGAIGIAILAQEEKLTQTTFRPIEPDDIFHIKTFRCWICPNKCEVSQIYESNLYLGSSGSRCGRWENKEYRETEERIQTNVVNRSLVMESHGGRSRT